MDKIPLVITKEEIEKLGRIMRDSTISKERQKASAIYWRAKEKTEKQIQEITGLAVVTIIRHIKKYNELGFDYLSENNYKGNISDLEAFSKLILDSLNKECPKTIAEACKRIEKLTGLKRSPTRVTIFLKKKDLLTRKQEVFLPKQTKKNKKNSSEKR
jgi:transposase